MLFVLIVSLFRVYENPAQSQDFAGLEQAAQELVTIFEIVFNDWAPKAVGKDILSRQLEFSEKLLIISQIRKELMLSDKKEMEKLEESGEWWIGLNKLPLFPSSSEQWKKDVMDLLKFNVSTQDDNAKWNKEGIEND